MVEGRFVLYMDEKWRPLLNRARPVEEQFATDLCTALGGEWRHATELEDKRYHYDIVWRCGFLSLRVDVKGAKRRKRTDETPDYTIAWLEVQNVHGGRGWLLGEASHIAFECADTWEVFSRADLYAWVVKAYPITETIPTGKSPMPHRWMHRYRAEDCVIMVTMQEMLDNVRHITIRKTPPPIGFIEK